MREDRADQRAGDTSAFRHRRCAENRDHDTIVDARWREKSARANVPA
jgi:hypothetical protein